MISTFILHVLDKNQLANLGHKEKNFNLFSKLRNGPIIQAVRLAKIPEDI